MVEGMALAFRVGLVGHKWAVLSRHEWLLESVFGATLRDGGLECCGVWQGLHWLLALGCQTDRLAGRVSLLIALVRIRSHAWLLSRHTMLVIVRNQFLVELSCFEHGACSLLDGLTI